MPGVFEGIPDKGEKDEISQNEVERRVRLSNIPAETITTHRLETWEHRGNESWWPKIEAYAHREYDHPFMALVGPRGTGKTHIAFAVGWEWLEQGAGVLYYHVEICWTR